MIGSLSRSLLPADDLRQSPGTPGFSGAAAGYGAPDRHTLMTMPDHAVSPVDRLRRWEDSGATWEVLARGAGGVVIALLSCDAGEEMDRLSSADPAVLAYVGDRDRRDDDPPVSP